MRRLRMIDRIIDRTTDRILTALLGAFLLAASARTASAAASDWRYLPIWGADVRAVALHPEDPDLALAGTSAGQLYVSRAGGLPNEPVYTLALVPGREGRIYAGTISGVYGTEDGGVSWRPLTADLPEVQKVTSLMIDPDQPETV